MYSNREYASADVTRQPTLPVYNCIEMLRCTFILVLLIPLMSGAVSDYLAVQTKLKNLRSGKLKPGARVQFSEKELNAWVRQETPKYVPDGVRDTRLTLGSGIATGTAMIDFVKVRRAQGAEPGWMLSKILQGEHLVEVTTRVRSQSGTVAVDVVKLEISGVPLEGAALDYLMQAYLRSYFPNARVGEPVELDYNIDRVDVRPGVVNVNIGR